MIHRNSYGTPYRAGTFDDPKTKDWLWDDPEEITCFNCGEDDPQNEVESPHFDGNMVVCYCDECYEKLFES